MIAVKEIFPTMQGEGSLAGTPAVFVRLAGCNLWSGTEKGRATGKGLCASWCDTDFVGGDRMTPDQLHRAIGSIAGHWPRTLVVITGGEPGLQLRKPDGAEFVRLLLEDEYKSFQVAVETNGTVDCEVLQRPDVHVTLSPKAIKGHPDDPVHPLAHIVLRRCTDLKLVVPQWSADVLHLMASEIEHEHLYLQPRDTGNPNEHLDLALRLAVDLRGRVSVQTHKFVGLP